MCLDGLSNTTKTFRVYALSSELLFLFFRINSNKYINKDNYLSCLIELLVTARFFIKLLKLNPTKYILCRGNP